jgi:hypothetical protein
LNAYFTGTGRWFESVDTRHLQSPFKVRESERDAERCRDRERERERESGVVTGGGWNKGAHGASLESSRSEASARYHLYNYRREELSQRAHRLASKGRGRIAGTKQAGKKSPESGCMHRGTMRGGAGPRGQRGHDSPAISLSSRHAATASKTQTRTQSQSRITSPSSSPALEQRSGIAAASRRWLAAAPPRLLSAIPWRAVTRGCEQKREDVEREARTCQAWPFLGSRPRR